MQPSWAIPSRIVALAGCLAVALLVAACDREKPADKEAGLPVSALGTSPPGGGEPDKSTNPTRSLSPESDDNEPTSPANTQVKTWMNPANLPAPQTLSAPRPTALAFRPLADAVVGEWTTYATMDGHEIRYGIRKAGTAIIQTEVNIKYHNKPLGQPAVHEDQRDTDPLTQQPNSRNAQRTMTRDTIKAAGRSWNALLYEERWTDEGISYLRRTWVSLGVPVLGIIRMQLFGDGALEAQMDMIASGRSD